MASIFFCQSQLTKSQLKINIGYSANVSGKDVMLSQQRYFYLNKSAYNKIEVNFEYEFIENTSIRVGYSSKPYDYVFQKEDNNWYGSNSGKGFNQYLFVLVLERPIYKGLEIGVIGGGIVNRATSNWYGNAELYRAELNEDTTFYVKQTVTSKSENILLPYIGIQAHYCFNNGIQINYLMT